MKRIAVLLVAAVAALAGTGCENPPAVLVAGDSLTVQTAITQGGFPAGWDILSGLGWEAEDVQPGLTQRVNTGRAPATMVVTLGQNDAADHTTPGLEGDGWTATDAQQMTRLVNTVPPATDVCWLLPAYFGTDPAYAAGIATYRRWVAGFAAGRGEHVFDWATVARPEHIDPDGVHLTPAGRLAYGQLITQEATRCG